MILKRSRKFEKKEPSRDAKLILIYCEGRKREPQYFNRFREISSRIRVEIVLPDETGDNSPTGLYERAVDNSDYEILSEDEVWFVIDTDDWGKHIAALKEFCRDKDNWQVAQSNPCFELWLYYHFKNTPPEFESDIACEKLPSEMKKQLNDVVPGGFDSKKHFILIKTAIENARNNFSQTQELDVALCSTEVFKLASNIYPLIKEVIEG